jgi:hypothetical protein
MQMHGDNGGTARRMELAGQAAVKVGGDKELIHIGFFDILIISAAAAIQGTSFTLS